MVGVRKRQRPRRRVATVGDIKAAVRQRDGGQCVDCGARVSPRKDGRATKLDVHRLVPGSPYAFAGCVTVCRSCHKLRHLVIRRPGVAPRHGRQGVAIHIWIRPETAAALRRCLEAQPKRGAKTDVVRTALIDFLSREGFYPPPKVSA
jgi:hypothetical protein